MAGAVAAAVVAVGVLVWALSGGGSHSSDRGYPAGRPPVPGTASPAVPAAPSTTAGKPGATGKAGATVAAVPAEDEFLDELGAIDPALVLDRDRAVANGRSTCADIAAHKTTDEVAQGVAQRFHVDKAKAPLIADAARNHLCP